MARRILLFKHIIFTVFCVIAFHNQVHSKRIYALRICVKNGFDNSLIKNAQILFDTDSSNVYFTDSLGFVILDSCTSEIINYTIKHPLYKDYVGSIYNRKRKEDVSKHVRITLKEEFLKDFFQPYYAKSLKEMQHNIELYPDSCFNATFPGGEKFMKKFFLMYSEYPEKAKENYDKGKVYASFIIEKDGHISTIKIIKSVSTEIDREFKRVIELLPSFIPSFCEGVPVPREVIWYASFYIN
ncbi:energy transducer TonB [Lishizhenia sp.]|uniref:energy transducer TonB n=1 Tax=Lishizhenia sp. TaxID=2497594 RepID=UPI00299E2F1A|nr:energy transducer TonB [Lishizhenia sp.]MDX1446730.1 energy transducer TonB [Lishizhenia sp.]